MREAREATVTPVAVIGMACRLPGGIDSPQRLWDALLRGEDFVGEIPADRWDADVYYDPEPGVPGRSVSRWGAFLDDVGGFDSDFFGMTEREAIAIDPQHRLLLEASWDAFEHAGLDPVAMAGSLTGVFVGLTHGDYELLAAGSGAVEGPYGFSGTSNSFASGRVSYALGLHGPAVTVDTACSSGLMAVHQACRSLDDGESDLALAGGVAVMLEPRKSVAGSLQGMLSPTGRCHSFDVAADGFVSGEGCVVLLLKRLPDAVRDGDRILAVVRGTAANQDGSTVNIATPSEPAQVAVYQAALAAAGVSPSTVGFVEAHGTGTPVGDPIEYASLAAVYGTDGPCALGSVKTNFGHCQSTSGPLGVMKAILALQHGVVPQNLHFTRLPDQLAEIETELFVPQTTTPWPDNDRHPRRAAVSSYGMSGTNVHAVLEQAPNGSPSGSTATTAPAMPGQLLFPLSATSADQLRVTSRRLAEWVVAQHADHRGTNGAGSHRELSDLAYTLARRRSHRPVRTAVAAGSLQELTAALLEVAEDGTPYQPAVGHDDRGPVWVFSGQGSQWPGMGAGLLATEPVFAEAIAAMEPVINRESGFSVTEAMSAPQVVTGIDRVQPTVFAMQVALAAALRSYGVRPGAVIGHSLGEAAAAVVAGGLSLEDGLRVICRRSRLMSRIAGSGAMASVELPAQQVLSELSIRGVSDVVIAVVASPTSTVVGGATGSIRDLVAVWEQRDVMAREIAVDVASHSPQVDPILDELVDALADLEPMTPEIPYYSATLWDPRDQPTFDSAYWADNLRYTVRFAAAVQAALADGHRVFGELAPHPLLTHAVQQNAGSLDMPIAALAAMRREQELPSGLRTFVADVHSAGAAVDFSALYPAGHLVDAPLPTWTHRELMLSRETQDHHSHGAAVLAVHPLLGAHVHLMEQPERHVWQGDVGTGAHPWLGDHQIHSVAALPGAAYCEMALAAAHITLGEASEVRDVRFEQTLLLDEQTSTSAAASVAAPGFLDFAVETHQDGERVRRASAVLHAAQDVAQPPARDIAALIADHPSRLDGAELRKVFDSVGIQYGPAFSGLVAAHTADGDITTVLAEVALPGLIRSQQAAYGSHPALLDACFQSVVVHPEVHSAAAGGGLLLPVGVGRLRCYQPTRDAHYCLTRVTASRVGECEADLEILDQSGTVLMTVEGLRLGAGVSEDTRADRLLNERLLTIEWERRELPDVSQIDPGSWLLLETSDAATPLTTQLADALRAVGAHAIRLSCSLDADDVAGAASLRAHLAGNVNATNGHGSLKGFKGVVLVTGPPDGGSAEPLARRGRDYVKHVVRISRELADLPGEPPRLYVVTRDAASVHDGDLANLEHAGLRGLMRVIDSEHPHLRATQIDVDGENDAELVALQLVSESEEDETAWRKGDWYTARLRPAPLRPDERRSTVVDHERDGMRLEIRVPGDLQTMEFVAFDRVPPGPGQIEVAVTASSVNFADVLVTFGRYPSFEGHLPRLGTDFAGVVTAVGPDVDDHRVGDHVGGMSPNGCWSTFVTCDARLTAALPAGLSDGQAAAVTTAHATAWHGLHDLARISSADKVLIHSGTGGVGQAAIAIARAAGAEIFATAGSPQRRALLHDMGIEHVYDSRSTDFADQIRRDTDGYGVDIVLNSLPGAAQSAGLELLSFGGRFIEIGKRDIYGGTRLGLFPFRRNLAFHAVDLGLMSVTHPDDVHELLSRVYRLTTDGSLPMPASTHYPIQDAAAAVRLVGSAGHTGKVVLDIAPSGRSVAVVPPAQARVFQSDGAYIVTGGLGGLGLFLAAQMAAAGCGRIVLNSRSEPGAEAQQAIERIRATGADICVELGDVAEPGTAQRLVAVAAGTGLPVRGVLHAAAVVEDATLTNVTDELIDRCWAPKVNGAWNMHQATVTQPLDWFCSFSSAAALVGSPGQGAYAAANSWLDAFAHWRRAQGLPSTAIAWGAWAEVGRATALAEALAEEAGAALTPAEGFAAFRALLSYDRPYSGYAPISGTPWLTAFAQRSRFAEGFRAAAKGQSDTGKFRAELSALPRDEWPSTIRRLVSDQLSLLLRRTIDPDRPLSDYGLDSLGNLELRTRIETATGVRISPTHITTVRGLAEHLCDQLATTEVTATAAS